MPDVSQFRLSVVPTAHTANLYSVPRVNPPTERVCLLDHEMRHRPGSVSVFETGVMAIKYPTACSTTSMSKKKDSGAAFFIRHDTGAGKSPTGEGSLLMGNR